MCIIVAKPIEVEFPSYETMETCFLNNDDGAGYMYNTRNKVHINKGYMTLHGFMGEYEEILKKNDIQNAYVFHFRIGTHGKKRDAGQCHPFPVASNYKIMLETRLESDYGIVHNGIIHTINFDSKYSDTMEFTKNILYPLYCKTTKILHYKELLHNILGTNKIAILDKFGEIVTIGDFIENKGILYSNNSYNNIYQWNLDSACKNAKECTFKNSCDNYLLECDDCAEFNAFYPIDLDTPDYDGKGL